MPDLLRSPQAREDLIDIWLYTFQEWGEEQADKYLDEIEHKFGQLKANPRLGRPRDDVRAGYRSLPVNQHLVFYTLTEEAITIIRVLHGSMDPDRHL